MKYGIFFSEFNIWKNSETSNMISREPLSKEHGDLAALAGRLILQIAMDAPAISEIASVRWEMTRKLCSHLAKEDNLLYPRLRAKNNKSIAEMAARFSQEMGDLAATYNRYIIEWSSDRILREWSAFRAETKIIMSTLTQRIEREESELYPMLMAA
jgi:hemerythrin-like domain-containing protein